MNFKQLQNNRSLREQNGSLSARSALKPFFKYLPLTFLIIGCSIGSMQFKHSHSKDPASNVLVGGKKSFKAQENLQQDLLVAISDGDSSRIVQLLKKGADVNLANKYGRIPLMRAVQYPDSQLTNLLIMYGAKVNTSDSEGITPLMFAAIHTQIRSGISLVNHNANVNTRDNSGKTALSYSIMFFDYPLSLPLVTLLIEKGSDINSADTSGLTPLMLAAKGSNTEAIGILIQNGANPNLRDKNGLTAIIHLLYDEQSYDALPKEAYDEKGKPYPEALKFGADLRKLGCLFDLVKGGTDLNARTKDGKTPLKIALEKGYTMTADYLKSSGAKE